MEITYIAHSCFTVELDTVVLIFDYYKGSLPEFPADKPLYVFSSHFHADHFNLEIFSLFKAYKTVNYILSQDIKRKYGRSFFVRHGISEELYDTIHFVSSGKKLAVGSIQVETIKSTDAGVAFIVSADGKVIYHAGDLNWWTWDEQTQEENEWMERQYKKEIDALSGRHFDAAFVVLDSRQGDDFYHGFDYFMRHTDTDTVCPMHFWGDTGVIGRLCRMECSKPYRDKIIKLTGDHYECEK